MEAAQIFQGIENRHNSLMELIENSNQTPSIEDIEQINCLSIDIKLAGLKIRHKDQRDKLKQYLIIWGSYLNSYRKEKCPFADVMPYIDSDLNKFDAHPSPDIKASISENKLSSSILQTHIDNVTGSVHTGSGNINYYYIIEFVILKELELPHVCKKLKSELEIMQQAPINVPNSDIYTNISNSIIDRYYGVRSEFEFNLDLKSSIPDISPEEIEKMHKIIQSISEKR